MAFAADDAGLQCGSDALIAVEVFAHDGLFQPIGIDLVDVVAGLDGRIGGPAHVHVDHDLDIGAERLAHGVDIAHVLAPRPDVRDLHLDGL